MEYIGVIWKINFVVAVQLQWLFCVCAFSYIELSICARTRPLDGKPFLEECWDHDHPLTSFSPGFLVSPRQSLILYQHLASGELTLVPVEHFFWELEEKGFKNT